MHERMFDIEVFGIMKHCQRFMRGGDGCGGALLIFEAEFIHCLCWGDWRKDFCHRDSVLLVVKTMRSKEDEKGDEKIDVKSEEGEKKEMRKFGDDCCNRKN
jgi:hypothetical protein